MHSHHASPLKCGFWFCYVGKSHLLCDKNVKNTFLDELVYNSNQQFNEEDLYIVGS